MIKLLQKQNGAVFYASQCRKGGNCEALQLEAARRRASRPGIHKAYNAPVGYHISTISGNARELWTMEDLANFP